MNDQLMLDTKVAFFGHRYVEDILAIEQQLLPILQELFEEHIYVDFYVGNIIPIIIPKTIPE